MIRERVSQFEKVDKTKYGWVAELGKLWNVSHVQVRRFLKFYCPDKLEDAFTRKGRVVKRLT